MNWTLNNKDKERLPRLKVPAHTASAENLPYTNIEALDAWFDDLPLANPAKSVRQLFEALFDCNRCNITSKTRFRITERFRQPIHDIRHNLERRHILDSATPLNVRNRNIAILNREVHSELAIAYKIMVKDLVSDDQGSAGQNMLITAIHRAIRHLSDLLVLSTMVYNPSPEHAWQEIHALYSLACSRKLEKKSITDSCDESVGASSIHQLYLQILMYALASPYCLRQRESQLLLRKLPEWVSLVELQPPGGKSNRRGNFVVRLASDEPPSHIKLQKKKISSRCRLLDTKQLVEHLEKLATEVAKKSTKIGIYHSNTTELPLSLIRYLVKTWDADPQRNKQRTTLHFELQLAIGLPSTHALLKEGAKAKVDEQPPSVESDDEDGYYQEPFHWFETQLATGNVAPISEETPSDSSNDKQGSTKSATGISSRSIIKQTLDEQIAPWASQVIGESHIQTYRCRTINESSGGYCMDWQGQEAPKVKVGELMGIQSTIDSNQFGVGVIRWIKHEASERLRLGMEIIAPDAVAVELYPDGESTHTTHSQKGLLLPEIKAKGTGSSIIIPTLPFQVGDNLLLRDSDDECRIQLTQLIESTAAFARYRFSQAIHEEQGTERDSDNPEEQGAENVDFEEIWSML